MSDSSRDYDIFLCHNSKDKPAVRAINEALRQEYNLHTFLDESALVGGEEWEKSIQDALSRSKACAILIGANGWGDYQLKYEAKPAVERGKQDSAFHAIPVLLPGAVPEELLDLRDFFARTHWVDFRGADELLAIRTLASVIRGENPFPEGSPRLTPMRIAFDSIRWDVGGRKNASILYSGKLLREALALYADRPAEFRPLAGEFLEAGKRRQNEELGRNLAAHAGALFNNPVQRELAANLALEAASRFPTPEAHAVLRSTRTMLPRVLARLGHPSPVTALATGRHPWFVATGCSDGSVSFWNGRQLGLARSKHGGAVRAAVYDPDGAWVATGGEDGSVMVWDPGQQEQRHILAHGEPVTKLDVRKGPQGTVLLASSGWPGHLAKVSVWNTADWTELWGFGLFMDAALDAGGTRAVLAWGDHIAVANASSGALEAKRPLGSGVVAIAAHPAQPLIAASTFNRQIWIGEVSQEAIELQPLGDSIIPSGLIRFSPGGRWLAAVGDDFRMRVWDVATRQLAFYPYEGLLGVDFAFSPGDTYLSVLAEERKSITFWHLPLRRAVCVREYDNPSAVIFSEDEAMALAAGTGTSAEMIELPRPDEALWSMGLGYPQALTFSSDGQWLAWAGRRIEPDLRIGGHGLTVLRSEAPSVALSFELPDFSLQEAVDASFDPEGRHVAAFAGGAIRIWNLENGTESAVPSVPDWASHSAAQPVADLLEQPAVADACQKRGFSRAIASPGRRWLAVHHGMHFVSVWDMVSATETISFSARADVSCMEFSSSGKIFATGDSYGGISVWNTSGSAVAEFQHNEPLLKLAFSPDENYLAAASADGAVRMWILATEILAAQVRPRLSRGLSAKEWECYLGDEPMPDAAESGKSQASAASGG